MKIKETINNIEKTVAIISVPTAAVVNIWANIDVVIYIEASSALIVSICEYIKLFIKDK